MGLFGKPPIPPIDDEPAVVQWFLNHDDELRDVRNNFGGQLPRIQADVLADLKKFPDGPSLERHVQGIAGGYENTFLPAAASLQQRGVAYTSDDVMVFFIEAMAATKMRVLGYFLQTKFRIRPSA